MRVILVALGIAVAALLASLMGGVLRTHPAPPPTVPVQSSTTPQWPLQLGDNGQPMPGCQADAGVTCN